MAKPVPARQLQVQAARFLAIKRGIGQQANQAVVATALIAETLRLTHPTYTRCQLSFGRVGCLQQLFCFQGPSCCLDYRVSTREGFSASSKPFR
jgi:hypothetical protein